MALVYRDWAPLSNTESYWDIANTHVQQAKEQMLVNPEEKEMANQIFQESCKVYSTPAGMQTQAGTGLLGTSKPPQPTLAQRINDKINRLQGQVEELQLVRAKLQAGKLDQLTMDDLSKLWDY